MKTKEERAEKYAETIIGFIPDDDEKVAYADYLIVRNAYLTGATEQEDAMHAIVEENVLRAIEKQAEATKREMIEKACKWMSGLLWSNYIIWNEMGYNVAVYNVEVDFRKAMGEAPKEQTGGFIEL